MSKILKLANPSRRNRLFFDNLIREIAICIHTGDTEINRDMEMPSYRGKERRLEPVVIPISQVEAMGFDTVLFTLPIRPNYRSIRFSS